MSRLDAVAKAFDPERLRLARQLGKLTKTKVADDVGVSGSLITQYEKSGGTRPTPATIGKLALALGVDAEFFMKERPLPRPGEAHFRSLRSSSKAERAQALAGAFLLWDMLEVFQQHLRLPDVAVPRIAVDEGSGRDEIEAAAAAVRQEWDLPEGPVGHVVRHLEQHGIIVTRLMFDTHRLDAFSVELDDRPFVILGDDKGDAARSRLDAAHELGHLVMHDEMEPGDGMVEHQAQQFGAAFLMPEDQIRPLLPSRFDLRELIDLKHQWGVSIAALLYRSRELGVMGDSTYRRAVTYMASRGYRTNEPAPIGKLEAPVLVERCWDALLKAGWTVEDLAGQLHQPRERVEQFLRTGDIRTRITV